MARGEAAGSISQADLMRLVQEARQWLASPAGCMLLDAERQVQREVLSACFGQHLVQYGLAPEL
ncbi:hypothetical protein UMZ34_25855 [Halopseudomonas pachastrellae]|nr:hypothetical protein UMZ34_25855 [Halopseudomonas pachastrellae]